MLKRKCVLGVLKTKAGLNIKKEMLEWLEPIYDITLVEVDPPNDKEFELPFIKKACEVSIENNEPVLYLHTKGAAMPNNAQPVVRDFWKHEFTEKVDQYFNAVNSDKALASAPIVGSQNPICWFNGFVMNSSAAKQILEKLSVHEDRYWFEQQMLKESNVSTFGLYDSNAEDGNHAWRSFCYWYQQQSKVSIYVCCHKDYENVGINNSSYKLISDKDIKNNSSLDFIKSDGFLDNRMWSEMTQIYYIWKHPELQNDWIGISHYRRYFEFMNDIPKLTKPVVAKHIVNPYNNYAQYDICHNSTDLLLTLNIIGKKKPEYYGAFIAMMDSHNYFPYNMFILPKTLFNEYCEFVFTILEEFDKEIGVNNDYINMIKHIGLYRERYVEKSGYPSNDFGYQARLYGFIAERLTTAFFFKYMHDNGSDSVEEIDVVVTEETYNKLKVKHLEDLKK